MPLNIVLVNPEIPQNTGNIARTCAATGSILHLIEPLGFSLADRYLKRAGLDYWHLMTYRTWPSLTAFFEANAGARMHFLSSKGSRSCYEAEFQNGDFLVFGCESRGLPESLLTRVYDRCVRIPMIAEARSLNLSNAVAIVTYEALRQLDFPALAGESALTGRDDPEGAWVDYV